ncbi:hypothetical protein MP228_007810 [Amoeboaphelidium protococcarum]|nr:hypothetical protein MP228_007810 [Amoeboaphelidium protococcarum]
MTSLHSQTRLFVRNISGNVTRRHLEEIFGYYGSLKDIYHPAYYPKHQTSPTNNGLFKPFAFVEYKLAQDAAKAIKSMNGSQLDGVKLDVTFAFAKERDQQQQDGGYSNSSQIQQADISQRRRGRARSPKLVTASSIIVDDSIIQERRWLNSPIVKMDSNTPSIHDRLRYSSHQKRRRSTQSIWKVDEDDVYIDHDKKSKRHRQSYTGSKRR